MCLDPPRLQREKPRDERGDAHQYLDEQEERRYDERPDEHESEHNDNCENEADQVGTATSGIP
jgi:hypothetical protein